MSARDRLRWSVCLLLNGLSGLSALFSLFCSLRYCSLTLYCSYFIGFSFNLTRYNVLRRVLCSISLLLYNLHFSALDNPLYSPLLRRPNKIIKMKSQTSIQHLLLPYVDKFPMISSRDLWSYFSRNFFQNGRG